MGRAGGGLLPTVGHQPEPATQKPSLGFLATPSQLCNVLKAVTWSNLIKPWYVIVRTGAAFLRAPKVSLRVASPPNISAGQGTVHTLMLTLRHAHRAGHRTRCMVPWVLGMVRVPKEGCPPPLSTLRSRLPFAREWLSHHQLQQGDFTPGLVHLSHPTKLHRHTPKINK